MLVPIDEEVAMGQLVEMVLVAEPSLAAAVAAHSFDLLAFLDVPFCFRHPDPNHHVAAAKNLRATVAGIGIEGVGCLRV